jgi:hypothetical protein
MRIGSLVRFLFSAWTLSASLSLANDIYACTDKQGRKTLQAGPCGITQNTVQKFEAPAVSANSPQSSDPSRGKTGMDACMALLNQYDLSAPMKSCALGDQACLSRAQSEMTSMYRMLSSHPSWRANNCDSLIAATGSASYTIEVAHNDELFIINGNKYKAKTYCFNQYEGDRVVFIEGSRMGVCVSAKWVNKRSNNVCEVWCE